MTEDNVREELQTTEANGAVKSDADVADDEGFPVIKAVDLHLRQGETLRQAVTREIAATEERLKTLRQQLGRLGGSAPRQRQAPAAAAGVPTPAPGAAAPAPSKAKANAGPRGPREGSSTSEVLHGLKAFKDPVTAAVLAAETGLPVRKVSLALNALKKAKSVKSSGKRPNMTWKAA